MYSIAAVVHTIPQHYYLQCHACVPCTCTWNSVGLSSTINPKPKGPLPEYMVDILNEDHHHNYYFDIESCYVTNLPVCIGILHLQLSVVHILSDSHR